MKNTDKVYSVIVEPVYPTKEREYLIRVPKNAEINEKILDKSYFFKDEWEGEFFSFPSCRIKSITEGNKKDWNEVGDPSLHKDGNIHYEGCEFDDLETLSSTQKV